MVSLDIRLKSWISRKTYSDPALRQLLEDAIEELALRNLALRRKGERIDELRAGGCRFDCRASRKADYLQGWVDRDRDCPLTESGKRCAERYVSGEKSGLKNPLGKTKEGW